MAGPAKDLAREPNEMRSRWQTDHAPSGRRLEALLPEFRDTPLDEVMRAALPKETGP